MSRRRFYSDYVRDRLEEIQLIVQFLQDITFDEFIVPILKRPPCVVFFISTIGRKPNLDV